MQKLAPKKVVAKSTAPKKVSKIQFCTLQNEDIQKIGISMIEIQSINLINYSANLYIIKRISYILGEIEVNSKMLFSENGCMDPRLGISDKISHCKTCK